jgi:nitroreductase
MGRAIIQHIDDAPWVRGGPPAEGRAKHPEGGGQLVGDLERGPWVHVNWLPGGLVAPPHRHDQDEVLFILEGGLSMGGRRCGPGTVVYLERATQYGFTVWDEGVRFLNIRAGRASIEMHGRTSDPYRAPDAAARAEPATASDGTSMGVFDAIYGLRAVRRYEDRPVPRELLDRILRAGTMACSSGNTQPWDFVVVTDRETQRRIQAQMQDAFRSIDAERAQRPEALVDGAGRPVTGHAAIENIDRVGAIVVVCWNPDRGIRMKNEYAENPDGTLRETRHIPGGRGSSLFPACQNMMLAARALGVSSLFTTFFGLRAREIKEILGIPPRVFLESAVFLGYGAEPLGQARRRPLEEVAHDGRYGAPWRPGN